MSHYHESDDLRILGEIETLAPVEFGAAPARSAAVTHGALALKLFDQVKGDQ